MKNKKILIEIFSKNMIITVENSKPTIIWFLEGNIDCFPGMSLESNSSSYESLEFKSIIFIKCFNLI